MKPRGWLWLWLAVVLVLSAGVSRLRFDVEVLNLLPSQLPSVRGLQLYQQHFANRRELLITLEAATADRAEVAAGSLASALRRISDRIEGITWQPPSLEHPDEFAPLLAYLWLNQPAALVDDLVERLQPGPLAADLERVLEEMATTLSPDRLLQLAYDPLRLSHIPGLEAAVPGVTAPGDTGPFASADGRFRILFIQGPETLNSFRAIGNWVGEIRRFVEEWRRDQPGGDDLEIAFTGPPVLLAEIGGGMQRDLWRSVTGMLVVIGGLFGLFHRTWRPLLKLLLCLLLILTVTLAGGGLVLGDLNVVTLGFAAMLLALAVDYGLVLYQESRITPGIGGRELRRTLAPGIVWAALTTSGAFLAAGLFGLPGLAQMALLVSFGIVLAAVVMLYVFLPWVHPSAPDAHPAPAFERLSSPASPRSAVPVLALTVALVLGALAGLVWGWPVLDRGTEALHPRHSPALEALNRLKERLDQATDPYWLVVAAPDDSTMRSRLTELRQTLQCAVTRGQIRGFDLPLDTWPDPGRQSRNVLVLAKCLPSPETLRQTLVTGGFTLEAQALLQPMLEAWSVAAARPHPEPPANQFSRWILERGIARPVDLDGARSGTGIGDQETGAGYALGWLYPQFDPSRLASLRLELEQEPDVWLTRWDDLGPVLLRQLIRDLRVVLPAVGLLLVVTLSLTFRHPREVLLSLTSLGLSLLVLQTVMHSAGWSWNLMNLVALPVLLGTGVDYTIHLQLALRRHGGNLIAVRRGVGRALLLCGTTTLVGFGSLVFSSNAGLASLGRVCATGMLVTVVITLFLLPTWWTWTRRWRPASPCKLFRLPI